MRIEASGASDVGRQREGNEDFLVVEPELGLFAVCDGMGGHAAGDVASRTAGEFIRDYIASHRAEAATSGEQLLRQAIEGANHAVFELGAAGEGRHGMGTTCTAVLAVGDHGFVGHVGDSRLYLLRDGKLDVLTDDHNYANEAVRNGILTREQAAESPYASRVTRAVGVRDSVAVDTLRFDVLAGDTLMLCSDGLYQYEDNVPLRDKLATPVLAEIPADLIASANEAGGSDNVTAVVLRAHSAVAAQKTRKTQVAGDLNALQHVLLFRDLSMKERCEIMNHFRTVGAAAGQKVLQEGEPSDSLFVVVEGQVEVSRGGARLAVLGPGHHFGEMALLSQRPRSATVVALEDLRALEMPRSEFLALAARDSTIAAKFLWQLAQMLSTRLDDVYVLLPDADRRTMQMEQLSPFRR